VVMSPNTETLKNALLAGQIDFGITDTSFARSAQLDARLDNGIDRLEIKEFEPSDMPESMKSEQKQEYGLAVRAGEIGLLDAINQTIAKAKQDGTLAAFRQPQPWCAALGVLEPHGGHTLRVTRHRESLTVRAMIQTERQAAGRTAAAYEGVKRRRDDTKSALC
jgi:hypothetical protein